MKAYLATTGAVFGILTILHVWRFVAEGGGPGREPWFIFISLVAAAFAVWSGMLLFRHKPQP